ncbi:hypothetical protein PPEP_b0350 [Pseudoalteromonas peptidolytica F12-50-A1]|uniref:Uncharacterized protein n=1 Tax=Pseudoalteromonas peptidolytica F12-50-A1 TaxID=1315280 RepID=A0A8I0T601_9GAMM|nr:hypothetical protein [Pseudoalteromonas peptidolytica F12-50-A1]
MAAPMVLGSFLMHLLLVTKNAAEANVLTLLNIKGVTV